MKRSKQKKNNSGSDSESGSDSDSGGDDKQLSKKQQKADKKRLKRLQKQLDRWAAKLDDGTTTTAVDSGIVEVKMSHPSVHTSTSTDDAIFQTPEFQAQSACRPSRIRLRFETTRVFDPPREIQFQVTVDGKPFGTPLTIMSVGPVGKYCINGSTMSTGSISRGKRVSARVVGTSSLTGVTNIDLRLRVTVE
jgi:hypothetical protein